MSVSYIKKTPRPVIKILRICMANNNNRFRDRKQFDVCRLCIRLINVNVGCVLICNSIFSHLKLLPETGYLKLWKYFTIWQQYDYISRDPNLFNKYSYIYKCWCCSIILSMYTSTLSYSYTTLDKKKTGFELCK